MGVKVAVRNLSKTFGGRKAVQQCSFEVSPGAVVGLIGPNGSGKSTLFNMITGLLRPDAGEVWFRDQRIDGMAPHQIARLGLGRTFQECRLFRELTVWENLEIAAMGRVPAGEWPARAEAQLERFGIADTRWLKAGELSVGQQRLVELSMNLVVDVDLLMLDEPVAGVHPVVRDRLAEIIKALQAEGKTFLLVEHNIPFVMDLCDKLVVLNYGEKIAEGPPGAVREDPAVIAAYLGRKSHAANN